MGKTVELIFVRKGDDQRPCASEVTADGRKWKCAFCHRGVVLEDDGGDFWHRKECKVCRAKVSVEVLET